MIEARIHGKSKATPTISEATSELFNKRKTSSPHVEENQPKKIKRGRKKALEVKRSSTPTNSPPVEISSSGEESAEFPVSITRKRKSILQPSGGKFSRKATARKRGLAEAQGTQSQEEEEEEDDDDDEYHDGQNVNEESLITTIRNAKDLRLLTNPHPLFSSDGTLSPKFLPRKYLELKVVEYILPSHMPQGPSDLWTCTFEGCLYRVHEASQSNGKKRVREHFSTHASQAQGKIELALNESRPYLPVECVSLP